MSDNKQLFWERQRKQANGSRHRSLAVSIRADLRGSALPTLAGFTARTVFGTSRCFLIAQRAAVSTPFDDPTLSSPDFIVN